MSTISKQHRRRAASVESLLVGETLASFEVEDPPLDHLDAASHNTHDSLSLSASERPETPVDGDGFPVVEPKAAPGGGQLAVVKVAASSSDVPSSVAPPSADILFESPPSFDETEDDGAVKPFSLQASPVKKTETSIISIDSIDAAVIQSLEAEKEKSAAQDSKWTSFGEPFVGQHDRSAEVALFTSVVSEDDSAFGSDVFVGLDQPAADAVASGDANVASSLIQQLGQLTDRLASLERIVHGMNGSNSDHGDRAQDVAFIVEGTEMLRTNSLVNEEITFTADYGPANKHAKGAKFSMKRVLPSRFGLFGKKGGRKSTPAEV